MKMALSLAKKGRGMVSPNPLVGAVVVRQGQVIAAGYHSYFGGPHAEVEALTRAGEKARGATLYLNLEPCHHYGKTPPCTQRILSSGISRVVVGRVDPNPQVSGKGIDFLRESGVQVDVGLLEEACARLNESFVKYIAQGIPFTILKLAATLDGKIATRTGQSKWITSAKSRALAHQLRAEVDAIMVGAGTVIADDPLLTYRGRKKRRRPLLRIVADSSLKIPLTARVLKPVPGADTLVVTTETSAKEKRELIEKASAKVLVVRAENDLVCLKSLMEELGKRECASLLIEGGSRLAASAIKEGVVDKVLIFYSPKILAGSDGLSMFSGQGAGRLEEALALCSVRLKKLGEDFLVEGYLKKDSS